MRKVATTVVDAMRTSPLAIALLVVNIGFLGFTAYVLGEVSDSSRERSKMQTELVAKLISELRDCKK